MVYVFCLLACTSSSSTAPADVSSESVAVVGAVTGWDGSGDVAIEACGQGALVDDSNHTFAMSTESSCELRVVWERRGQRAVGQWHGLDEGQLVPRELTDGAVVVKLVLPMPEDDALRPLSSEERAYREAVIEQAQEELLAPVSGGGEGAGPGV